MADIIDEQRDQLLRKLVRSVVVRAVGHDGRHTIGIVKGTDKMVAARLTRTVGTMRVIFRCLIEKFLTISQMMLSRRGGRGERRLDTLRMGHLQSTIDLVGRDVVETFTLILLRQRLPIELRRLQEAQRAHHVRPCEGEGILDAPVHMALGCQVDDAVHLMRFH